ncbi:TPA: hypothetical protein ACPSKE_002652 [Legionella feeleii]|uniref:Dot/Icm secretion system substrate n=1 Tax=Legionella feeleii TaxID=453 RepID=A0A378IWK3_9GAMM|nr:hypothetical protein [Legionella feeleii]STX39597.1 Dot/Icm secretion system substrate [Legionella feeleii]
MSRFKQFSSEFADLTKAVAQTPDNYNKKAETLGLMAQMKALATSGDMMAQYRLAQAYPKHSVPYFEWMQAAACQGFTNAMLALSTALLETKAVSAIQQAAKYLVQILRSDDSYIKDEATALLDSNRLLKAEVNRQMGKTNVGKTAVSFFAKDADEVIHCRPQSQASIKP